MPESSRSWLVMSVLRHPSDEPPLMIYGAVRNKDGKPIPNATIEVWQTDSNGMYDNHSGSAQGELVPCNGGRSGVRRR